MADLEDAVTQALYVSVVMDRYDGSDNPYVKGSGLWKPSLEIPDPADLMLIGMAPVPFSFRSGSLPSAKLVATDSVGPQPAGWTWNVTYGSDVPGSPAAASYYLPAGPASFTATHATPAVFTWTATASLAALPNGTGVQLSGGSLPDPFTAGTTYFVVGASGATFGLAAAQGGAAIASTGSGSGTLAVTQYNLSQLASTPAAQPGGTYLLVTGTPAPTDVPVYQDDGSVQWGPQAGSGGGLSNPMTTAGDTIYGASGGAPARLAGNTAATRKFLRQLGTGSASAAPAWDTLVAGDIPSIAESQVTSLTTDLAAKAPLASPAFTGTPAAPTPTSADNSTKLATTAFVGTAITNLGLGTAAGHAATDFDAAGAASSALTTAEAYTDAETTRAETAEALKAPLASPALTGNPTAPTQSAGNNSTRLATTAYADGAAATAQSTAEAASVAKAGDTMTGHLAPKVVTLTDGSSVALNAALGNSFSWVLGGSSHTLAAPSNPVDGQSVKVRIKYGGSFTPLFNSVFDFGAAGQPSWSAASGKTDIAGFEYDALLNGSAGAWAYLGSALGLTS